MSYQSFKSYQEAYNFLEAKAQEEGLNSFEIVEDTYEIPNGLALLNEEEIIFLVAVEEWLEEEEETDTYAEYEAYAVRWSRKDSRAFKARSFSKRSKKDKEVSV